MFFHSSEAMQWHGLRGGLRTAKPKKLLSKEAVRLADDRSRLSRPVPRSKAWWAPFGSRNRGCPRMCSSRTTPPPCSSSSSSCCCSSLRSSAGHRLAATGGHHQVVASLRSRRRLRLRALTSHQSRVTRGRSNDENLEVYRLTVCREREASQEHGEQKNRRHLGTHLARSRRISAAVEENVVLSA